MQNLGAEPPNFRKSRGEIEILNTWRCVQHLSNELSERLLWWQHHWSWCYCYYYSCQINAL